MPLTLGPLSQIARPVASLDRARQFWRETLDLPELFIFPGLAFFALGQTRLMLRETGTTEPADILYFAVPDIGSAHATLSARGVLFQTPPHRIHRHPDGTEEWMAFLTDDEGRTLALHAQTRPAAP